MPCWITELLDQTAFVLLNYQPCVCEREREAYVCMGYLAAPKAVRANDRHRATSQFTLYLRSDEFPHTNGIC